MFYHTLWQINKTRSIKQLLACTSSRAERDWTDNGLFIYRVVKFFVVYGNDYHVFPNSKHVRQGKAVQIAVTRARLIYQNGNDKLYLYCPYQNNSTQSALQTRTSKRKQENNHIQNRSTNKITHKTVKSNDKNKWLKQDMRVTDKIKT